MNGQLLFDEHTELAGMSEALSATFHFNLEPLPGSRFGSDGTSDEYCAFKREFFRALDVPMADRFWTSLSVTHPRLDEIADALAELMREGTARPTRGSLAFRLEDIPSSKVEWFTVFPHADFPADGWPPKSVKACNVTPGKHIAGAAWSCHGSERLREVVESEELQGIEFEWIPDKGKYRAPQWFRMIPLRSLGRGVDHPGFDWVAYQEHHRAGRNVHRPGDSTLEVLDPEQRAQSEAAVAEAVARARTTDFSSWRRYGCATFHYQFSKPDWTVGNPAADRVARMFPRENTLDTLTVISFTRLLRQSLPDTDFGFVNYEDRPDARDGNDAHRMLCFNRRTRDLLVGEGVVLPRECFGMLILDEIPPGTQVLDRVEWPVSEPDPEKVRARRSKADNALADFLANPKPVREATMKRSLAMLRHAKAAQPEWFGRRGSAKKVQAVTEALDVPIPGAWCQLLRAFDGFELYDQDDVSVRVMPCADLTGHHTSAQAIIVDLDLVAAGNWLHVGHFYDGDTLSLDLSRVVGPECVVLRLSHETHDVEQQWPSVAAFLEDFLT